MAGAAAGRETPWHWWTDHGCASVDWLTFPPRPSTAPAETQHVPAETQGDAPCP